MTNQKNIFLKITTFLIFLTSQSLYTKDSESQNNSETETRSSISISENDMLEYDTPVEDWAETKNSLNLVIGQTKSIEYCLQQLEQALNAGKINFNAEKSSKSQILEEIKSIKSFIQDVSKNYPSMQIEDAIITGTFINNMSIQYLMPILLNDITEISSADFQNILMNFFNGTDPEIDKSIQEIMLENEKDIKKLLDASVNVGLTSFNKMFRYIQDEPLPLIGKPLFSTAKQCTLYAGFAFAAYAFYTYITPDGQVNDKPKDLFDIKSMKDLTGSMQSVDLAKRTGDIHDQLKITEKYRLGNFIDDYGRTIGSACVPAVGTYLLTNATPIYEYAKEVSNNKYNEINNYLRGDLNKKNKTSAIMSDQVEKVFFNDIIGRDDLKEYAMELAQFIKNPARYEVTGIYPPTGCLLAGPSQTGKSHFAQALKTLIDEECKGSNEEVKFLYVKQIHVQKLGFNFLFRFARENAPFILFIDEIDLFNVRRDKDNSTTDDLMTNMSGLNADSSKKVIVIAATNRPEELDFALLQHGRLGKVFNFQYPTYEDRKEYLHKSLTRRNLYLEDEHIDAIAQETENQTYNTLNEMINAAVLFAMHEMRPVTSIDFEKSLDREIRKIQPNTSMTPQEKEIIAIYHAGQGVARHVLATEQEVVTITVNSIDKPIKFKEGYSFDTKEKSENSNQISNTRVKSVKLGSVFTHSTLNNPDLMSDSEQEKELLALLAGQAALELIKGNTYQQFGKEDRAKIIDALEKKIAQNGYITDEIRKQALLEKDILYTKIKNILKNNTDLIQTITDELIKNNSINKHQWNELTKNHTTIK